MSLVKLIFLVPCVFRINYRLTSRTKPKSAHSSLMANGAPLPVLNGYTQTLLQNFPQYSQKYCKWLTNGFKVQSFRTGHNTRFSHSRPPPPLLQYINRPKTVSGRLSSKKIPTNVDINVVGVQKEVSAQKQDVCDVTHDVMWYFTSYYEWTQCLKSVWMLKHYTFNLCASRLYFAYDVGLPSSRMKIPVIEFRVGKIWTLPYFSFKLLL